MIDFIDVLIDRSSSYWTCRRTTASQSCQVDTFLVDPGCGTLEAHIAHVTKSDVLVTISFLARLVFSHYRSDKISM